MNGSAVERADIDSGNQTLGHGALRLPEFDWQNGYPGLVGLRARLSERPSFQGTIPEVQQIDRAVM